MTPKLLFECNLLRVGLQVYFFKDLYNPIMRSVYSRTIEIANIS